MIKEDTQQLIDISNSVQLTIQVSNHDNNIVLHSIDKNLSLKKLRFERHNGNLHIITENGRHAVVIEDYFSHPVKIYGIDEDEKPHAYVTLDESNITPASLNEGEAVSQQLAAEPASENSISALSSDASDSLASAGAQQEGLSDKGILAASFLSGNGALLGLGALAALGGGIAVAASHGGNNDGNNGGNNGIIIDPAENILLVDGNGNPFKSDFINTQAPFIQGNAKPGCTVIIKDDQGNIIAQQKVDASGAWKIPLSMEEGSHHLNVVVMDEAGNNSNSVSKDFTVDVTPPTELNANDTIIINDEGHNVKHGITNDETPTISGHVNPAEAGGKVIVKDNGNVIGEAIVKDDGSWSITAPAMDKGSHNISGILEDKAGNQSGEVVLGDVDVDVNSLPITEITLVEDDGTLINISHPDTKDSTPTIQGKTAPGATVTLKDAGKTIGTAIADESGHWSITPTRPLKEGLHDKLSVEVSGKDGGSGKTGLPGFTVDTVPPAAPNAENIDFLNSEGHSIKDGATHDAKPIIQGKVDKSEAGGHAIVKVDGNVVGDAIINSDGSWSIPLNNALSNGNHQISVILQDKAGNLSGETNAGSFEINTKAPPITIDVKDDHGNFVDPLHPTKDTTPTLSGKTSPNVQITLSDGDKVLGTTTADKDGNWSITLKDPLVDGTHALKIDAKDSADNHTKVTVPAFEVDTVPPAPLNPDNIEIHDHNGNPVSDVTKETNVVVNGSGLLSEAGGKVIVMNGDKKVGEATIDAQGNWSLTTSALSEGSQNLTAIVQDKAGNQSQSADLPKFDIDLTPPAQPSALYFTDKDGNTIAGEVTNKNPVVMHGKGEIGSEITIKNGTTVIGTTKVGDDGNWEIPLKALPDNDYNLTVTATDKAGNTSATSDVHLQIDTHNSNVTTLEAASVPESGLIHTNVLEVNGQVTFQKGDSYGKLKVVLFDDKNGDGILDASEILADGISLYENGSWHYKLSGLENKEYNIKAVVVDEAGNLSQPAELPEPVTVNMPELDVMWGTDARSGFGTAIQSIGHFTDESHSDLAISAPQGGQNNSGVTYVIRGQYTQQLMDYDNIDTFLSEQKDAGIKIHNSSTTANGTIRPAVNDHMGLDITSFDLDGDGLDELVISSHVNDKVYIIWGGQDVNDIDLAEIDHATNENPSSLGFVIYPNVDSWFGYGLTAYDCDGDGRKELLIGDGDLIADGGGVFVLKSDPDKSRDQWHNIELHYATSPEGLPGWVPTDPSVKSYNIYHQTNAGSLGVDMQNIGDINGDGYDDFIVLDYDSINSSSGRGEAFVVYGREEGFAHSMNNITDLSALHIENITQFSFGQQSQDAVAPTLGGGDWWAPNSKVLTGLENFYHDSDQCSDIAIADPYAGHDGQTGKVWIIRGKDHMGDDGVLKVGVNGQQHIAIEDGFAIVSSRHGGASSNGVHSFGSRILGGKTQEGTLIDFNLDGIPDLVISDPLALNADGQSVGAVYVVYGGHTDEYVFDSNNEVSIEALIAQGLAEVHYGTVVNGHFGSDIEVKDMDGSGALDIIVGSSGVGSTDANNPYWQNGSFTVIYNQHLTESSVLGSSLEKESGTKTLLLDGDHQNVDLTALTGALKAGTHHIDLTDGNNTLTVNSSDVAKLSQDANETGPFLTVQGKNGNVELTGGNENWHDKGNVTTVDGTTYHAFENSSQSQILVDERIHVTIL